MDITLHIGAHKTAVASFHAYLAQNARALQEGGVQVWGPARTRTGLFDGIVPRAERRSPAAQYRRASGRMRINVEKLAQQNQRHLLISDHAVPGRLRDNLACFQLYRASGERVTRHAIPLDGGLRRVVLTIRSLDDYWADAVVAGVMRGHSIPTEARLDHVVTGPRTWRQVIEDVACAVPDAELVVLPFEQTGARPEHLLRHCLGDDVAVPTTHARQWENRTPGLTALRQALAGRGDAALLPEGEGPWQPFNTYQRAALRERYADDLYWLRAGADGHATWIEDSGSERAGINPVGQALKRGQDDEREKSAMG